VGDQFCFLVEQPRVGACGGQRDPGGGVGAVGAVSASASRCWAALTAAVASEFIAGEQLTPGAPWRIRLTDEIRKLFIDDAPDGWLAMLEATLTYRVSRQTIMQRVKRGELKAVHVRTGRRKGLRIQPPPTQEGLF
jgi:hypothetical protein